MQATSFSIRIGAIIEVVGTLLIVLGLFVPSFINYFPSLSPDMQAFQTVVVERSLWDIILQYAWWGDIAYVVSYLGLLLVALLSIVVPLFTTSATLLSKRGTIFLPTVSLVFAATGLVLSLCFIAWNSLLFVVAMGHSGGYKSFGPGLLLLPLGFALCFGSRWFVLHKSA
jgi:hypothetical protein